VVILKKPPYKGLQPGLRNLREKLSKCMRVSYGSEAAVDTKILNDCFSVSRHSKFVD
jgi:hypothetical protein